MQIKFNHLECSFCGFLSRQSQFFCSKCGNDLKYAKTIPVPLGQISKYQEIYRKPSQSLLLDDSDGFNAERIYRQLVQLSSSDSVRSDLWQCGREMSIETKNFTLTNILYFILSFGLVFNSGASGHRGVFYIYTFLLIVYGLYRRLSADKDGDTILISEDKLEVYIMNSRNNIKLQSIAWKDIDRFFISGDTETMRLCLEAQDGSKSFKFPVFHKSKRTMMLNAVGIMAHKNEIMVE